MARIENHKYSIAQAFRECFYVVPDYQREYVWTEKEVHQLLDDIAEQVDSSTENEYFIGMVLVSQNLKNREQYEVIDGQQRLTTFYLLLCAIRNRYKEIPQQHKLLDALISTSYVTDDGDVKASLKLEPRYENAGDLMKLLVAIDGTPAAVRSATQQSGIKPFGSLDNLLNAYSTIYQYLNDNYEDLDALKTMWGYLANKVVFIQISTDVSSALKIFETINDRGVGLNPMDLLKNLLFTQVQQEDFTTLKNEWKKITGPLEIADEKPLRFLRYFLMANYRIRNKRSDNVVREDEIYEWFMDKDNSALAGYKERPFEFVRRIIRSVDQYLAFAEGRGNDGKASIPMENLRALCGEAFSLHYILLLAASGFPTMLFAHFVRQLESFLFYYIFTKTPTKELERNFSAWADELRSIGETKDPHEQIKMLNSFVAERFKASMDSKANELSDALRRYSLLSMQRYRTKYLLAKLTQHVDMAFNGTPSPGPLSEYKPLEIEHILPNNGAADLRAAFSAARPDANYDEFKNHLGNLTLLEKPINIVVGRGFFEEKMPEYKKCARYLTSSIVELKTVGKDSSINRMNPKLKSFSKWDAESIDQRQAMLIDLSKDVWRTSQIETD